MDIFFIYVYSFQEYELFLENDMCQMPWKDALFSSQQNLTTMVSTQMAADIMN